MYVSVARLQRCGHSLLAWKRLRFRCAGDRAGRGDVAASAGSRPMQGLRGLRGLISCLAGIAKGADVDANVADLGAANAVTPGQLAWVLHQTNGDGEPIMAVRACALKRFPRSPVPSRRPSSTRAFHALY